METVGSFEAKTHLPQLLERAAREEEFTITQIRQAGGPAGACRFRHSQARCAGSRRRHEGISASPIARRLQHPRND